MLGLTVILLPVVKTGQNITSRRVGLIGYLPVIFGMVITGSDKDNTRQAFYRKVLLFISLQLSNNKPY